MTAERTRPSARIAVAMSGGVDSSVAAALLVAEGQDVLGITMDVLPSGPRSAEPIAAARAAARALGIEHVVVELREVFARLVIEPFCRAYRAGRTPNPCVECNRHIKFGALLERARELGAEWLATGHYARVGFDQARGRWTLRTGADAAKDQSYVLYGLTQEQLSRARFPLGGMTKAEVRERARRLSLPAWERPESQQACFVGDAYGAFLERWLTDAVRPGPIVDRAGRQVGRHRGIAFYTIGQRHGLRIARGRPWYVVAIDATANRIIVGEESELRASRLRMTAVNYVSLAGLPEGGASFRAKVRSAAPAAPCTARAQGAAVTLEFTRPQRAIAPGQSAVCYDQDVVALGGVIDAAW